MQIDSLWRSPILAANVTVFDPQLGDSGQQTALGIENLSANVEVPGRPRIEEDVP